MVLTTQNGWSPASGDPGALSTLVPWGISGFAAGMARGSPAEVDFRHAVDPLIWMSLFPGVSLSSRGSKNDSGDRKRPRIRKRNASNETFKRLMVERRNKTPRNNSVVVLHRFCPWKQWGCCFFSPWNHWISPILLLNGRGKKSKQTFRVTAIWPLGNCAAASASCIRTSWSASATRTVPYFPDGITGLIAQRLPAVASVRPLEPARALRSGLLNGPRRLGVRPNLPCVVTMRTREGGKEGHLCSYHLWDGAPSLEPNPSHERRAGFGALWEVPQETDPNPTPHQLESFPMMLPVQEEKRAAVGFGLLPFPNAKTTAKVSRTSLRKPLLLTMCTAVQRDELLPCR